MRSALFNTIARVINAGNYEISEHAGRKPAAAGLLIERFAERIGDSVVVEEYPKYHAGACVLCLQIDEFGRSAHLLWGIAKGTRRPAYLVTAYRPDPARWSADYLKRRPK